MVKPNLIKSIISIEKGESLTKSLDGDKLNSNGWSQKPCKNNINTLTLATSNPHIRTFKAMEYAARGPVILRAMEIENELRQVGVKFN